jgi:regulatory protein
LVDVYQKALALVARREYCRATLGKKLCDHSNEQALIDDALTRLEQAGLLSDARFVAMTIYHRSERGDGPLKIKQALLQKGLCEQVVESGLSESSYDWIAAARKVHQKKFDHVALDFETQAKQRQFLYYRGFSEAHIEAVFE